MADEKLTILVADDSKVIRKAFSRIMDESYDLIEAADGAEAWELIQNEPELCAVFTDWEMPGLDGLELAQKIRASKNALINSLPIIMVTSKNEDDSNLKLAYDAGVNDFVAKPFDATLLLARAKTHVKPRDFSGVEESSNAVMDVASRVGNTKYFQEQGTKLVAFANRHNLPVALTLIGVDGLKAIMNKSSASPKEKEQFLQSIGLSVAEVTRKEDSIARIGKGVLGVILTSMDAKQAHEFAEQVQSKIKRSAFDLGGEKVKVTVSIGIGISEPERKHKLPMLIKTAQERLQRAFAVGNEIRPVLRDKQQASLVKLDSLDKSLALITNHRAENIDTVYLAKRIIPMLVHFDKKHGTQVAKSLLPIIKGN